VRPLRYSWLWLGAGLLLVATVIIGSLGPPIRMQAAHGDKIIHLTAYLFLALWFGGIYRPARYPIVAAGLVALGGAIELVQGTLPYRSMELADAAANTVGVVAGIVLSWLALGSWCQLIESRLFTRV
jgi:VanZ family protein